LIVNDWQPEFAKVAVFGVTLAALLRFKKLPEPIVVLAAAAVGLVLYPLIRG
jgi:chromate transporter